MKYPILWRVIRVAKHRYQPEQTVFDEVKEDKDGRAQEIDYQENTWSRY